MGIMVGRESLTFARSKDEAAGVEFPADVAKPSDELAAALVRCIPDDGREHLVTVAVGCSGSPLSWQIVSEGTVDSCPLYPRDVYGWSVGVPTARFVGVVHNHPSGDTTPSSADVAGTKMLSAGGSLLGHDLLWSLVVTHRNATWSAVPLTGKGGTVKNPPVPGGDDAGNQPVPEPEGDEDGSGGDEGGEGEGEGEGEGGEEPEGDEGEDEGGAGTGTAVGVGGVEGDTATAEDLAAAIDRLIDSEGGKGRRR